MIDEREGTAVEPKGARGEHVPMAIALAGASREEADAFLRKQGILADLQIEELKRELHLRHWSLRFGNISAVMKVTFEIALAFLFVAVAAAIAAAVWSAAHDDSLVIESFSVPPDLASRGLTGEVVSARLQDALTALQNNTFSSRPAASYANYWSGGDIRVQIPDTGVSIGEFYRLLASWLGRQTRITGAIWRKSNGTIAVTSRVDGAAATVSGSETDFDKLLWQSAESIYKAAQPYRYAIYEAEHRNLPVAHAILRELAKAGNPPRDRAWALVGLAVASRARGPAEEVLADDEEATAIVPNFAVAYDDLDGDAFEFGREETALKAARAAIRLLDSGDDIDMNAAARSAGLPGEHADAAFYSGDFADALRAFRKLEAAGSNDTDVDGAREMIALSLAHLHEIEAARASFRRLPRPQNPAIAYDRVVMATDLAYVLGDWRALASPPDLAAAFAPAWFMAGAIESVPAIYGPRRGRAFQAFALARLGRLGEARALIARTPLDCDPCMRIRGKIEALAGNWSTAAHWFAVVAARSPDIPFADTDWGEMLLLKGDYDGAIAKFAIAHAKGPHFADPLEMWGEALMQKNRSDLALAKFAEANKYAPNWGRLHLEWGKALFYLGHRAEAQQQLVITSHLGLNPSDAAALAQMRANHA
ncbi:MAG TPA: hypothetical protein VMF67_07925 [Rhizomicrobium sp.]|nr:hypothetical protein [Rhizomicrobium sp.]